MNLHAEPTSRATSTNIDGTAHQFTLEQLQASRLLSLLLRLDGCSPVFSRLQNNLEDALRLAVWSRREVRLEVSVEELPELIEALAEAAKSATGADLEQIGEILLLFSTRDQ